MKAIVVRAFGAPDVMKLEEVPDPRPGAGQVLVKVHAAGVNPMDTYKRNGNYGTNLPLPYTPGADLAGVVEDVGPDVTRWKRGDRVYSAGVAISGGYAERALCAADQVYRLPDRVTFAQGAALGVPYATAWRGLMMRGQLKPADTLLVHGASGAVGTAAIQIGRAHGARVIGTAGTADGLALVLAQGAHVAINHRDAGYEEQIKQATGGRGVDIILEMLANENLDRDLDLLARDGRVIVVGNRGRTEIDARRTMQKDADIRGLVLFNTSPADMARIHAAIEAGLENGTLNPVIGREMPLADAVKAHELVMAPGAHGKIVLIP